MDRELNLFEATAILEEYYVTNSIQIIARWVREGRIKAHRSSNRKEGWRIIEGDLYDFIDEVRPGLIDIIANCSCKDSTITVQQKSYNDDFGLSIDSVEEVQESNKIGDEDSLKSYKNLLYEMDKTIRETKQEIHLRFNKLEEKIKLLEETQMENRQLKFPFDNDQISPIQKDVSEIRMTFKEFGKLVEDESFEHDVDETSIRELYEKFFDPKEGKLLKSIYTDDPVVFICPITGKNRKRSHYKGMLKKAIREKFEDIEDVNEKQKSKESVTEKAKPESEVILNGSI